MGKLIENQIMPNFLFSTPFQRNLSFYQAVSGKKSILLFLRFIGCRLTQLAIQKLRDDFSSSEKKNMNAFVVVQSEAGVVREYFDEGTLPFTVICDPEQTLYKQFDIQPAKSIEELQGGETKRIIEQLANMEFVRGKDEGEPLQLPALVVVDEKLKVLFQHYGKNATDIPDVTQIMKTLY